MALLAAHIVWMRRRRLSPATISTRFGHILRLLEWLQAKDRTLLDADHQLLDLWHREVALGMAVTSERNTLSNAREFYRWCAREEHLTRDPSVRLILPRPPRRRPRPIAENNLAVAVQMADAVMKAILLLAGVAGLRAVEIARLAWTDVDLNGDLYISGKGGHERAVPVGDTYGPLAVALRDLPGDHRRGPVIPRLDGKPGHNRANTLDKRANDYLHGLGITDTLHKLRSRFATVGYRETRDPIAMARLMGHANTSTIMIYADSGSDEAQRAIAATNQIGAA